jgi:cation diffusion facilitator CzcD-associated flavoprotein CzcO
MCDIESYIYLPMLEETGYMPKMRYAGGEEIRAYADLLADKYNLRGRALFQTSGKSLTWNTDHWSCKLLTKQKGQPEKSLEITANFIILASGTFTYPKLPNLPGLDSFKGKMIHTARWNYVITGGAPALTGAALTGLKGKKVALVGTGATAIQVVPNIAKHAGELYVFQRTPSAVDVRNNHETDPDEWKTKIANKKGWQIERGANFQAFTENAEDSPKEDVVDDGWTNMPTISGAYGGNVTYSMEQMEQLVEDMQKQDAIRSERVRKRAQEVVKDAETAKVSIHSTSFTSTNTVPEPSSMVSRLVQA